MREEWKLTHKNWIHVIFFCPLKVVVDHFLIIAQVDPGIELAKVGLNIEGLLNVDAIDHMIIRRCDGGDENRQKHGSKPCRY